MSEHHCFHAANIEWNKCSEIMPAKTGPDIEKQVCYIIAKLGYDRCLGNLKKQGVTEHKEENAREDARK